MATTSAKPGDRLLAHLGAHLGRPDLNYSQKPIRLTRGMFAEVWAFALTGGPGEWTAPLVLRLYPQDADHVQLHVEAAIQNGLAAVGFPAPRTLLVDDTDGILGRRFIVMERMPGRPALRGVRWDLFLRGLPALVRSWPARLAAVASRLHACPTEPVLREIESQGLDHPILAWDRQLRIVEGRTVLRDLPGWQEGLRWLRRHHPPAPAAPTVIHGDLWPANLLYDRVGLTGVVDWDRATLGDPALDIGFAKAGWALMPAPSLVPPPIHQALRALGRSMGTRIEDEYAALAPLDQDAVRYYEALRCAVELSVVLDRRTRPVAPKSGWEHGARALASYFREITQIELETRPM